MVCVSCVHKPTPIDDKTPIDNTLRAQYPIPGAILGNSHTCQRPQRYRLGILSYKGLGQDAIRANEGTLELRRSGVYAGVSRCWVLVIGSFSRPSFCVLPIGDSQNRTNWVFLTQSLPSVACWRIGPSVTSNSACKSGMLDLTNSRAWPNWAVAAPTATIFLPSRSAAKTRRL